METKSIRNVVMSYGNDVICDIQLKALASALDEYTHLDSSVYRYRGGSAILSAQLVTYTEKPSIPAGRFALDGISFGEAQEILRFELPEGAKLITQSNRHDSTKDVLLCDTDFMARQAIKELTNSREYFMNRGSGRFESGIYTLSNNPWEIGKLMILEARYGRFLMGVGDDHIACDYVSENEYIMIATAKALTLLFPCDEQLLYSYIWMVEHRCGVNQAIVRNIESVLDNIFKSPIGYIGEYTQAVESCVTRPLEMPDYPFDL